jgi:PAS domain S-box-containing protein
MSTFEELFGQTGDGVAVIDGDFRIIYWNEAATDLLGHAAAEALGRSCHEVMQGMDERGGLCGPGCSVVQCALRGERLHSYNILSRRKDGKPVWLNMSTLYMAKFGEHRDIIIHLFRNIDHLKRAESLIQQVATLAAEQAPTPAPAAVHPEEVAARLTEREQEILRLLSRGLTAKGIARQLTISEATTRNHIQSILNKLGVHSQLEAVLYALQHNVI